MTQTKLLRENLIRALPEAPLLERGSGNKDSMPTLRGHFAVWDSWTEINSAAEGGRFMERFSPTSMSKTLSEGRDRMRVLFQHGRDAFVGDKPLGTIEELEPDDFGARYSVKMLDTAYNREIIPGLEAKLYGASFRFRVMREEFDPRPSQSEYNPLGLPERTVTEAAVTEFGPVTFPAYSEATAGLRSMTDRFVLGRLIDNPDQLAEAIALEKEARRRPRVTVTYGDQFVGAPATSGTSATGAIVVRETTTPEPDPPEDTTPPTEPEPPAATTREEPGTPHISTPRFRTRREWLEWISKT